MKIIIYAPKYDENNGGAIVLHTLCHMLRQEGVESYLWPLKKPVIDKNSIFKSTYNVLKFRILNREKRFKVNKHFNTPVAQYKDLKDSIVLYPEITKGNPLLSKKVIRWFLYNPDTRGSSNTYSNDELYFYYQKVFIQGTKFDLSSDYQLNILSINPAYKQTNFGKREGRCFILRKGKNRKMMHNVDDGIIIDDLSHDEIAEIFNRVEYCFSYDLYTMYSLYASLCGCKSVVVPEENLTKEEWSPEEKRRYGVAYGMDDIDEALQTRTQMIESLKQQELQSKEHVRNFIKKTEEYFI